MRLGFKTVCVESCVVASIIVDTKDLIPLKLVSFILRTCLLSNISSSLLSP